MKNSIQLLPDHIANQIAAGEVVQRPASVVKELLENSVDAEATSIDLIIEDAGKTLMQVVDDGLGMNETDARLAFERHATSKIQKAEDLFNLHTKGFRGEALASITAVSHVQLKTRTQDQELGTLIKVNGSVVEKQEACNTAKGASIAVKNLFFNVPARRNFLKSNQVESRHITDEFQRVALAHSEISFSLIHNKNKIYVLPSSNLKQRILNIFGKKINKKLVAVEEQNDFMELRGYIGKPDEVKKNRSEQFFFVNDRFVRSNYLSHAVNKCYENLIPKGYYPSFFIHIKVDPTQIDVNIHPTKTEIKFQDESVIYTTLKSAIRRSLGIHNVTGTIDFDTDPQMKVPYDMLSKKPINPGISVSKDFNPFKSEAPRFKGELGKKEQIGNQQNWQDLYSGLEKNSFVTASQEESKVSHDDVILEEPKQEVAFEEVDTLLPYQVHQKYVLLHSKDSFLLIHQGRASQRVLYERYKRSFGSSHVVSQKLLFPINVDLNKNDMFILRDIQDKLIQMGFGIVQFSEEIIVIEAIPVGVKDKEVVSVFESIIEDIRQSGKVEDGIICDIICRSMAKVLAISIGCYLTLGEMKNLVDELFNCQNHTCSPFGKKIFIEVTLEQLDKKLG